MTDAIVRFESHPIVPGPLNNFNQVRAKIVSDVVQKTMHDLGHVPAESLLSEALFLERMRLKRFRANFFTAPRKRRDQKLWGRVRSGLVRSAAEVDRKRMFERVVGHFRRRDRRTFQPEGLWFRDGVGAVSF